MAAVAAGSTQLTFGGQQVGEKYFLVQHPSRDKPHATAVLHGQDCQSDRSLLCQFGSNTKDLLCHRHLQHHEAQFKVLMLFIQLWEKAHRMRIYSPSVQVSFRPHDKITVVQIHNEISEPEPRQEI